MLTVYWPDREISWEISQGVPTEIIINAATQNGTKFALMASGKDLKFIQEHFTQIPMCNNKNVTWIGDVARFIVLNLIKD